MSFIRSNEGDAASARVDEIDRNGVIDDVVAVFDRNDAILGVKGLCGPSDLHLRSGQPDDRRSERGDELGQYGLRVTLGIERDEIHLEACRRGSQFA